MTKPREGPRFVRTIMLVTEGSFGAGGGGGKGKKKGKASLCYGGGWIVIGLVTNVRPKVCLSHSFLHHCFVLGVFKTSNAERKGKKVKRFEVTSQRAAH